MRSTISFLALALPFVAARFGQEQAVASIIQAIEGGEAGEAATLAGASISTLLAGSSGCDKLTLADEVAAIGGADALEAAKALVQAEKNFNPFVADGPNVCDDAALPATEELRGIIPLIDPEVEGAAAVNEASAASLDAPVDQAGSTADLLLDLGFETFTPSSGGAAAGGADDAAGDDAAAADDAAADEEAAAGDDAAADDAAADDAANAEDDAAAADDAAADEEAAAGDDAAADEEVAAGDDAAAHEEVAAGDDAAADEEVAAGDDAAADEEAAAGDDAAAEEDAAAHEEVAAGDDAAADEEAAAGDDAAADEEAAAGDDAAAEEDAAADEEAAAGDACNAVNNGAANNNNNDAAAAAGDLQTFAGALGGIAAEPILDSGNPDRPFEVAGATFVGFGNAATRTCDRQFNACANAANGGDVDFAVADCTAQKDECQAAQDAAAAAQSKRLRRRAQKFERRAAVAEARARKL